jgi:DNA polymerase-3 subunit delta'
MIGHQKQWEFLKNKFEAGQLSHAYLFTGEEGIGKKLFAKEFAGFIGCKFPDLLIVKSADSESSVKDKKDNLEIDVGQIRDVQKFLAYKSYNGGYKIIIVENAERMNVDAQDCLLKDLEEPKGETLFILISSKPDMLLSTIFSRCQTMKFFKSKDLPENSEKSAKEKELLKGLLAVIGTNFAEKFKYVKAIDFEKQDAGEIVQVLQKYLREQLLSKIGTEGAIKLKNNLELTQEINNKLIFTNANPKLALEILLMEI